MLLRPILFRTFHAKQACGGMGIRCVRPTNNLFPVFSPTHRCGFATKLPSHTFSSYRLCSTSSSSPPKYDPAPVGADPITPVLPVHVVTNESLQKYLFLAGNAGYIILASGMLMTDVLLLRCLLASGYLSLVCYHIFQLRPLRIPLFGSAFFVAVNIYFAIRIFLDRQVNLSDDEKAIWETHFKQEMQDFEFEKIIRAGEVITVDGNKSTEIVQMGKTEDHMFFVLEGEFDVCLADETHLRLGAQGFFGEHSFISRNSGSMKANAHVDALPGCKFIRWDLAKLSVILKESPQTARPLESMVGRDLAQKLLRSNDRLSRTEHKLLAMRCCYGSHTNDVSERLEAAFKKYDQDGGSTLTFNEFDPLLTDMSGDLSMTEEQKRRIFTGVDVNGDGEIDVKEFMRWLND